jgi:hypothetical protein
MFCLIYGTYTYNDDDLKKWVMNVKGGLHGRDSAGGGRGKGN